MRDVAASSNPFPPTSSEPVAKIELVARTMAHFRVDSLLVPSSYMYEM